MQCPQDVPEREYVQNFELKGIKTVDVVKKFCEAPKVEISEGGIGQAFAVVRITSARGCGIDSWVYFYTDKPDFSKKVWNFILVSAIGQCDSK